MIDRVEAAARSITRLRNMVAIPKDLSADDLELQLADYAIALAPHDPRDLEAACRRIALKSPWWPKLAELREAVEDVAAERRAKADLRALPPPDPSDPWSADARHLPLGLSLARAGCLLASVSAAEARGRFNAAVHVLGLAEAVRLTSDMPDSGSAWRALREAAAGPEEAQDWRQSVEAPAPLAGPPEPVRAGAAWRGPGQPAPLAEVMPGATETALRARAMRAGQATASEPERAA